MSITMIVIKLNNKLNKDRFGMRSQSLKLLSKNTKILGKRYLKH